MNPVGSPVPLEAEVESLRGRVDARLLELLPAEEPAPDLLHRAVRYSLAAPGKRIRPLVTLLTAARLGGDVDAALDPACALEMVHTASLIVSALGPGEARAEARRRLEDARRALAPLGPAGRPLDEIACALLKPGVAAILPGRRGPRQEARWSLEAT